MTARRSGPRDAPARDARRRGAAATRRRLEPRRERLGRRSPAPLVRLDGRWWHRIEIVAPSIPAAEPSGDANR